jgi:signal transduction histidine kinase
MRLSYKVFMTSALVILALLGVATWSLLAISRLVDVNRSIATQSLPALRMGASLREQLAGLTRTEMDARPQEEQKGLTVERTTNGSDFALLGDEDRLLRVVLNLVGNAIKFTPHGGAVKVSLADVGPEVVIMVEDTGVGIPANDLRRIFDPYEQAHRGRGGSGLGLAIVKGLVELHGGQVEVESEEGRGSRFLVRLPRVGAPLVGTAPPGIEQ